METGAFIFLVVETTAIRAITKQTREQNNNTFVNDHMSSLPTNDTIYQSIHTSMCGTKPAEESNTKLPTKR